MLTAWLAVACGGRSQETMAVGGSGGTAGGVAGTGGAQPRPGSLCPDTVALPSGAHACVLGGDSCHDGPCQDPRGSSSVPICSVVLASSCKEDGDCPTGLVCTNAPYCTSGRCVNPCTPDSCNPGLVCQTDGHCVPVLCSDGYACADGFVCAPERPVIPGHSFEDSDGHGCSPASCVHDGWDCPEGTLCDRTLGGDLHGCNPPRCDEGGACPLNQRCDPLSTTYNHCIPLTCQDDKGCDCGTCLSGVCATQPGYCGSWIL